MGSSKRLLSLGAEELTGGEDIEEKAKGNKKTKVENVRNEVLSTDNL